MELSGLRGEKKWREQRALELLDIVGLKDKAKAYPAQLSGGQQQRVAIARALATNPKVLLCDEATSALDPKTTRQILELIGDINKKLGITVVIITHQMSVVKEVCNHVAILDDGEVVEEGLVSTVFSAPKSAAARHLVFPRGADIDVSDPQQHPPHLPQREDDIHSARRAPCDRRGHQRDGHFGQHAEALRRGVRQHAPRRAERAVRAGHGLFKKH